LWPEWEQIANFQMLRARQFQATLEANLDALGAAKPG
jgi:hypothetical protein